MVEEGFEGSIVQMEKTSWLIANAGQLLTYLHVRTLVIQSG